MLLSLPLVSCTFTFVTLSLTGSQRLVEDEDSGMLVIQKSLYDYYVTRNSNFDMSLLQFASEFSIFKGEAKRRSSPVIVRTFPTYSSNPQGNKYDQYCKYQLVKHKPWHGSVSTSWGGVEGTAEVWIREYHEFLQTNTAQSRIPHFHQELESARQCLADEDDSDDEATEQVDLQDDWMQLCQLQPRFEPLANNDSSVDWSSGSRELPESDLRECPTWISSQRRQTDGISQSPWRRQLPIVDITTLNIRQQQAYNTVKYHHLRLQAGQNTAPLYMIISGTAGTGKSYLISAISQPTFFYCHHSTAGDTAKWYR